MLSYTKSRLSAAKAGFAGKKLLLFIIILSSFSTINSFAQNYGWKDISANIPGTPDFSDVFFVSDNEGWITSSSQAEIYHTTNGGDTFEVQTTQYTCNAIHMLNANEGYAGGAQGRVYRTTDGGENWIAIGSMGTTLADISFPPSGDTGYCCGINGNIHAITSSGVTKMTSNVNGVLSSISFPVNSEEGWVCGGSLILHFINDAWVGDQFRPSGGYNAIYMSDSLNGWAVGDVGIIIQTKDGVNWSKQTNPDPASRTLFDVFFLNSQLGWAIGSHGRVLHTIDAGSTWTIEADELTSNSLTGVHFTSPTNGYVVGNGKTLLKYGEITSVENEEQLPSKFSLSQNYPNPFNPSTKIRYEIPGQAWNDNILVTLKVYDVLGNEVAILVDEYKPAGRYEVEFYPASGIQNLASGIYFYQLKAGEFIRTKKMILLK